MNNDIKDCCGYDYGNSEKQSTGNGYGDNCGDSRRDNWKNDSWKNGDGGYLNGVGYGFGDGSGYNGNLRNGGGNGNNLGYGYGNECCEGLHAYGNGSGCGDGCGDGSGYGNDNNDIQ